MHAPGPAAVVRRLHAAATAHDLDAVVSCFAPDYCNETPAHPRRGFAGREQVRRNWTRILAGVPDIRAQVLDLAVDGDTVWAEVEHSGTRGDGTRHAMCGVVIFRVADGVITAARFYLEPVQDGGPAVDGAVALHVQPGASR